MRKVTPLRKSGEPPTSVIASVAAFNLKSQVIRAREVDKTLFHYEVALRETPRWNLIQRWKLYRAMEYDLFMP